MTSLYGGIDCEAYINTPIDISVEVNQESKQRPK